MRCCLAGVPAEKRGNSFLDIILRKSIAFACSKGGESRFSPFGIPHRALAARIAVIGLILLPCLGYADIYQYIDPQGNVIYSDKSAANAKSVKLSPAQTYSPLKKPASKRQQQNLNQAQLAPNKHYKALSIVRPTNNEPVRQNQGTLVIQANVDPPLTADRKLRLLLDNRLLGAPQTSSTFVLSNLDRGTHTIQIQVIDQAQHLVQTSQIVTFHMLKFHSNEPIPIITNIQNLESSQRPSENTSKIMKAINSKKRTPLHLPKP